MDDFVRYNGRVLSAKSCLFTLALLPVNGITSVKFSDGMDIGVVYGSNRSGAPLGATGGKYAVDTFTVTMLKDVWVVTVQPWLQAQAALLGLTAGLSNFEWDFVSQLIEEPLLTSTDTISNCRLAKVEDGYDEGTDALVTNLTMGGRMTVNRNGSTLYDPIRDIL